MRIRIGTTCLFALLLVSASAAQAPLGTAFTYQGRLESAGSAASGLHDLRFRLHDAAAGGAQVGATLCADNVSVTDGLFTVLLDFGAPFAGEERFLEIDVRADTGQDCTNPAGFVILGPRQPLTAAPNALFARNASLAATATNATQLNGQPAAFYQNASNINSGTLADAGLSANVAILNTAQAFSAVKTFSAAPSFTASGPPFAVSSTTLVANLNADRLDGLNSTAFLQGLPVPLVVSGSDTDGTIHGTNSSATQFSPGVYGENTSTGTGNLTGGRFVSRGDFATGVWGEGTGSTSLGGVFRGGAFGLKASAINPAVSGGAGLQAICDTGSLGIGIHALVTAPTSGTYGVFAESQSNAGTGVFGSASRTSGTTYGGSFATHSPMGFGGFFENVNLGDAFDVELSGPNGAINTGGFLYREYTPSTPSAAVPVAYGSISAAGATNGGTGNFTVSHSATGEYDITISGETYSNNTFAVSITPLQNAIPMCGTAADVGVALRINIWRLDTAVKADVAFQFVVYATNPSEPG